jgi:hypothetical protein
MFDKSGLGRATASAAGYARYLGCLLFALAERSYEVHMERAQMRLTPTRRAGRPRD